MSTSFTTDPGILYEEFLKCDRFTFESTPRRIYREDIPHMFIMVPGSRRLTVYRDPDTGFAAFERFGNQDPTVLQTVIDVFGVKVTDYCGLDWPLLSGG